MVSRISAINRKTCPSPKIRQEEIFRTAEALESLNVMDASVAGRWSLVPRGLKIVFKKKSEIKKTVGTFVQHVLYTLR